MRRLTVKQQQAAWDSMTPAKRRVAIARDVIAHLERNELTIEVQNGYVSLTEPTDGGSTNRISQEQHYGNITPKQCDVIRQTCTMCARGALLISRIDMFNSISWTDIQNARGVGQIMTTTGLDGAFGREQLNLIECAFEGTSCWCNPPADYVDDLKIIRTRRLACKWRKQHYGNPANRLLAIMQNIVDHRGTFKPEVKYITEEVTYYV